MILLRITVKLRRFYLLIVVMPVSLEDVISVEESVVIASLLESVERDSETVL